MNREAYLKIIADSLGTLSNQVELRNSINLLDINIILEDFFKDFLNLIYGYELINLNIIEKNTSAIDLVDKNIKLAIQVTSDNSSTKINKTINKFIEKELYKQYHKLQFLILIKKRNYTKTFETNNLFTFNKDDIIDFRDILHDIKEKDTEHLLNISNFLEKEVFIKVNKKRKSQANEIETIIDLIEYLSSNKEMPKKNITTITDPNDKINRRFKKYADFLKKLYADLVGLYGNAVAEAHKAISLDDVKNMVIRLYLRDISNRYLEETGGNPKLALENLTQNFEDQLSNSGKKYDKMAIKFYLISETIKCNVFPNEEAENESISS